MGRKTKIMVPESREALDRLKAKIAHTDDPNQAKYEVAKEKNIPLSHGYNGKITAENAGRIGGALGGGMVKELTRLAMEQLKSNSAHPKS
ncbi:alpha/beta hydrolase [Bacillus sp. FJAT-27916]|uniref:small, acid-soluble spore protein, alpha/beta type n=1 Tax=Bacillaceae TaxID=186817 RepID=UPI000670B32A|nr:small, acid-soluble spore protein, alpha/beta type [Bacillus sp. FJAT-27916]KMY44404.1 alpha/beta hydrolase [Bacillus sp. FJAT-27916]